MIEYISPDFEKKRANLESIIKNKQRPFIIGISGASGSGKSFLRKYLLKRLSHYTFTEAFTQDNYYIDFAAVFAEIPLNRFYDEINLDAPEYIRFKTLQNDLSEIKNASIGQTVLLPKFKFGTPEEKPTILQEKIPLIVPHVLITEGIHALFDDETCKLYDLKIFVEVDETTRYQRWLHRNLKDNRGTTDNMWQTSVDCHTQYILPSRQKADIVLNNNVNKAQMSLFIEQLLEKIINSTKVTKNLVNLTR